MGCRGLSGGHHRALDNDAGRGYFHRGDEELARQGDDGRLAHPPAKPLVSLVGRSQPGAALSGLVVGSFDPHLVEMPANARKHGVKASDLAV
jgi:hypothetical protein